MKGTYRTALEWAKLMLSIDPEGDPYCMRLMIHHLAIRSSEYQWFLDVSESKIPSIWSPTGLQESHAGSHTLPSLAFAALQLRDQKKARKLLTESMKQVPWVYTRLFKELNLDAPPSIWGIFPRTDAETLFTEIYVLQTKDLWNTPEATALLMEIGHTIRDPVDVSSLPKLENKEMTLDVVRFVYLDNTPALMSLVPSKLLHRENNSDSDPLPPDTNIFSYDSQRMWINRGLERRDGPGGLNDYNPIAAIARMLPGFGIVRDRAAPGSDDQDIDDDFDQNDNNIDADELRRGLEEAVRNGGEDTGGMERMPSGVAQTLLNMLGWGGGAGAGSGGDGESDDDEFVDAEDGEEDSDEENYVDMPDLMDEGMSDDEMPPLVANR